jgi:N-acetylneuraminic acid mutarotase
MKSWEKVRVDSHPKLCSNPSTVLNGDKLWVFGGYHERENKTVSDFYQFNLFSKEWTQIRELSDEKCPPNRMGHSAVVHGDYMYIFFGWNYECRRDIWRWSFSKSEWEEVKWTWLHGKNRGIEVERYYHQTVVYNNRIFIVFGCVHSNHSRSDQLFEYDTEENTMDVVETIGNVPTGRSGTTCGIYDDNLYIFGGYGEGGIRFNDFYSLDLKKSLFEKRVWKKLDPLGELPPATSGQSGTYFGGSFYLFGGSYGGNGTSYSSETLNYTNGFFKFDFITSRWRRIQSKNTPSERSYCSAFIYTDSLLLFGGSDKKTVFTDVFLWKLDFCGYGHKSLKNLHFADVMITTVSETAEEY